MSINIDHLRHALYLAGEPSMSDADLGRLIELLGVPEEVLPYLVLKRDAFKTSPAFLAALKTAARHSTSPQTRRPASSHSRSASEAARREMAEAVRALIDRDLDDREAVETYEAAQRRFVEAGAVVGFDAAFRLKPA